jgi:hypothetical protein
MERFDRIAALTDELRRIAKELEQGFIRYDQVVDELRSMGLTAGRARSSMRPEIVPRPPLTTQILDLLAHTKRRMKPREITHEIRANPGSVRTTMGRLSKMNLVKRAPEGWYV